MYPPGTRVTVTAQPDSGASFKGWSDYKCAKTSLTCSLRMSETRYITALFDPVTLTLTSPFPDATSPAPFGDITVSPALDGPCRLTFVTFACTYRYKQGTTVSLTRQQGATGGFWIGSCE